MSLQNGRYLECNDHRIRSCCHYCNGCSCAGCGAGCSCAKPINICLPYCYNTPFGSAEIGWTASTAEPTNDCFSTGGLFKAMGKARDQMMKQLQKNEEIRKQRKEGEDGGGDPTNRMPDSIEEFRTSLTSDPAVLLDGVAIQLFKYFINCTDRCTEQLLSAYPTQDIENFVIGLEAKLDCLMNGGNVEVCTVGGNRYMVCFKPNDEGPKIKPKRKKKTKKGVAQTLGGMVSLIGTFLTALPTPVFQLLTVLQGILTGSIVDLVCTPMLVPQCGPNSYKLLARALYVAYYNSLFKGHFTVCSVADNGDLTKLDGGARRTAWQDILLTLTTGVSRAKCIWSNYLSSRIFIPECQKKAKKPKVITLKPIPRICLKGEIDEGMGLTALRTDVHDNEMTPPALKKAIQFLAKAYPTTSLKEDDDNNVTEDSLPFTSEQLLDLLDQLNLTLSSVGGGGGGGGANGDEEGGDGGVMDALGTLSGVSNTIGGILNTVRNAVAPLLIPIGIEELRIGGYLAVKKSSCGGPDGGEEEEEEEQDGKNPIKSIRDMIGGNNDDKPSKPKESDGDEVTDALPDENDLGYY